MVSQTRADKRIDLLVTGGTVVTMDGTRRILEDGAVAVRGDEIVAVASRAELEAKYTAAATIDAKGKLVLPGFINGHTHVPMTFSAACTMTSRSTTGSTNTSSLPKPRT